MLRTSLKTLEQNNKQQEHIAKKELEQVCLPNLKLSTTPLTSESIEPVASIRPLRNVCQIIKSDTNCELVSSSIISSSSNNADLSEDEQINYYDDENLNLEQPICLDLASRALSNSSEQTLVLMPNKMVITETVNLGKQNIDADDEEELPKEKKTTMKMNCIQTVY